MFTIFEFKDFCFHKALADPFLALFEDNPLLNDFFQNYTNATFILSLDDIKKVYGGALLIKQKITFHHKKVWKNMANSSLMDGEIWTCTICLRFNRDNLQLDFESFSKLFYQNLYKKLVEFGMKEKISYLCMILDPGEYLSTEKIGAWPYVLELIPSKSSNDLFHGILSLKIVSSNTQKESEKTMYKGKKLVA